MIPDQLAERIVAAKKFATAALNDVELSPSPVRDRAAHERQASQMDTYARALDALAELFQQARDALTPDAPGWLPVALASAAEGERAHAQRYRDYAEAERRGAAIPGHAER